MNKLIGPLIFLFILFIITSVFQYKIPTFLYLFQNMHIFLKGIISAEVWPLFLTIKILIIPILLSALTIRTFCRYIHETRRSVSKTHLTSTLMYLISIFIILTLFSFFNYFILVYLDNPGNLLFFFSRKKFNISDSKFLCNIMLILTIFLNSMAYIISTYFLEYAEMKRINKINERESLLFSSEYITRNIVIIGISLIFYSIFIILYLKEFYDYLKSIENLIQPIIYVFLFTSIGHLNFAGLYMKYTDIPIQFALIGVEEKNENES